MNALKRFVWVSTVAVTALVFAAPAYAQGGGQAQPNTGVGIGALGGFTFTTVATATNELDLSKSGKSGYMFGIWFGGNRDGRVGLMGELSYVTKKVKVDDPSGSTDVETKYIEIPVLARINMGSRQRTGPSFYVLVGPVFDIQFQVKENGEKVDNASDVYQGLDIGLMAGAGFEVARIGVEGRYSWGLKSVLATDAAVDSGFGKTRFNTFQILVKVRFN